MYIYSGYELSGSSNDCFHLLDVGGQIEFDKTPLAHPEDQETGRNISSYRSLPLSPAICHLAYTSGRLSRFRIDPHIPRTKYESLYATWVANTLQRHPFGSVFVYQMDGHPVGLITFEWDRSVCTIGLLAVLDSAQGRGIATKLIRHVESFCMRRRIGKLRVKTQLSNLSARSLYLKCGFVVRERSYLYHARASSLGDKSVSLL
ncbi:GNAT family N-acetyltransferase [Synechococcus sp. CCY 0621]|uniref:GNAT family N-acetyltransferase n=1 Tax=Synechococcus sp. CCY 0621 TaxID=2815603 RepID=UPI003369EE77